MRIYIDTEFDGDMLLSLALVPADTSIVPLYEILQMHRPIADQWVLDNVYPILNKENAISKVDLGFKIGCYLQQFPTVHIIADHPTDIRWFCDVIDFGDGVHALLAEHTLLEIDTGIRYVSEIPHNALADALAIRDAAEAP